LVNGKKVCSSTPTYAPVEGRGPDEKMHFTIMEMSLCHLGRKLTKGDRISFVSTFDLAKYPLRRSNMGHEEAATATAAINIAFPIGYELP
jgi:hypothetical protein